MSTRRTFLQHTATLGAGLIAVNRAEAAGTHAVHSGSQSSNTGGYLGISSNSLSKVNRRGAPDFNTAVVTTDVGDLPYEMDGDVKVFRLTAHVMKQQIEG
jgi:hypothetical protein